MMVRAYAPVIRLEQSVVPLSPTLSGRDQLLSCRRRDERLPNKRHSSKMIPKLEQFLRRVRKGSDMSRKLNLMSAANSSARVHHRLGRRLPLRTLALAASTVLFGQRLPPQPEAIHAKVMILGTFHFEDAGLDDYKPKHRIDFLSTRRQKEVAALLHCLAGFRPNKIAVEWPAEHQAALDAKFREYLAGSESSAGPNEIFQVGFRLARRLGHQRIHAVDAKERPEFRIAHTTEELIQRAKSLGQHDLIQRGTKWARWYEDLYGWADEIKTKQSLLDHLRLMNSPEYLRHSLSRYLVAEFEVGGGTDYTGADTRTAWYNRNLRIFSNVLRIRTANSDRILLIIGGGHVPLLLQMAQNAPEFELVPALSVLKQR